MKLFRILKALNKGVIIDILFYAHLTIGFLIASLIAVIYNLEHMKVAFSWSILFIYLLIEKTREGMKK